MKSIVCFAAYAIVASALSAFAQKPIIVDHTCTDVTKIPLSALLNAKQKLHIAYGHTSHGSQLTTGMTGLVVFANNGGKGLQHPENIFAWNNGGTNGALDLHDYAMSGDCGYYPQWVNNTKTYLNNPANKDVNVIMWSWCGQVTGQYTSGKLWNEYLLPMTQLEKEYPGVTFVYMTGHVDFLKDADNKKANDSIVSFCLHNNKVLYDFADIERYDPDGTYYEFVHDNCNYYESAANTTQKGNWATEWQNSHAKDVDWYSCQASHSQPLNANQKAYAAWWLFARIAGWEEDVTPAISNDPVSGNRVVVTITGAAAAQQLVFSLPFGGDKIRGVDILTMQGKILHSYPAETECRGSSTTLSLPGPRLSGGAYVLRLKATNEAYCRAFTHIP